MNYVDSSFVIWITGLSGSGKTTIAKGIQEKLLDSGEKAILLDGDKLREVMSLEKFNEPNHSKEARLMLARKYSQFGKLISEQGVYVIIATISLFREVHEWNRKNLRNYFEVYLDTPIEELIRRDSKKIYTRYMIGELKNVVGMDLPFDIPSNPDYTIRYEDKKPIEKVIEELYTDLMKRKETPNEDPMEL